MDKTKVIALNREKIFSLTQFAALIGLASVAPLLGQQAITGPIVNATIFISVVLLGLRAGILIGLVPSLIALSVGFLPLAFAPIIPFIITGNIILAVVFKYLKEKNYWLGIIAASLLKFIFLLGSSSIIINFILEKEMASKMAMMMSWPQFFTALAGGLLAYLFLKSMKKIKV